MDDEQIKEEYYNNAIGFSLNIEDWTEEDDEEISDELYYEFFPRFNTPLEMEENLVRTIRFHILDKLQDKEYDTTDLVIGINTVNLYSEIDKRRNLESNEYDIYNLEEFDNCYYVSNDNYETKIEITKILPIKKIVAKYFPDYTEEQYTAEAEIYEKEIAERIEKEERYRRSYPYWSKGRELKKEGKYKEAAEAFETCLEIGTYLVQIYTSLADCYRKLNDVHSEIRILKMAIEATGNTKYEKALMKALSKI